MISEDPEINVSMQALLSEEYHGSIKDLIDEICGGKTSQDIVLKKMFKLIHHLASLGKVILVSRAASCLTADLKGGFHIRLVASLESRIRNMVELLKISEKEASSMIHDQDKSRASLARDCFNADINDPLRYHVTWNTDKVSIAEISRLTVASIEHFGKTSPSNLGV